MLSAAEKEPGRRPTGKEIKKLLRILGAASVATGPAILDTVSAHVEAAPQNDTRDSLLSLISIPELPQIATPVPNSIGGRGFELTTGNPPMLNWREGRGQQGYALWRLGLNSGRQDIIPQGGLQASATSFNEAQVLEPTCYALLIRMGLSGPFNNSDVLCVFINSHSPNSPQGFKIKSNESNIFTLSWNPELDADYLVADIAKGRNIPVSRVGSYDYDAGGSLSCIVLAKIQRGILAGYTDFTCVLPIANFSNQAPESTSTPTRTATTTSTATATKPSTATPTGTPTSIATRTATITSTPETGHFEPWPQEIADAMSRLVLSNNVRLFRSVDSPPRQPNCIAGCYLENEQVVWLVTPSRYPDPAPDFVTMAYELGHDHKRKIREIYGKVTCARTDMQRCWEDTPEYQAFIDTFNTVNTRLRQQGKQELTLNDNGYYITLFNNLFAGYVLGDPLFVNEPTNWTYWVPDTYQHPEWVRFYDSWARKN